MGRRLVREDSAVSAEKKKVALPGKKTIVAGCMGLAGAVLCAVGIVTLWPSPKESPYEEAARKYMESGVTTEVGLDDVNAAGGDLSTCLEMLGDSATVVTGGLNESNTISVGYNEKFEGFIRHEFTAIELGTVFVEDGNLVLEGTAENIGDYPIKASVAPQANFVVSSDEGLNVTGMDTYVVVDGEAVPAADVSIPGHETVTMRWMIPVDSTGGDVTIEISYKLDSYTINVSGDASVLTDAEDEAGVADAGDEQDVNDSVEDGAVSADEE